MSKKKYLIMEDCCEHWIELAQEVKHATFRRVEVELTDEEAQKIRDILEQHEKLDEWMRDVIHLWNQNDSRRIASFSEYLEMEKAWRAQVTPQPDVQISGPGDYSNDEMCGYCHREPGQLHLSNCRQGNGGE